MSLVLKNGINSESGDSNLSGGQLCCRGTNSKLQPRSFTVLHRSLQLYPEGGSIKILYSTGTREVDEKQPWGSLPRYRDMKLSLGDFSPGLFPPAVWKMTGHSTKIGQMAIKLCLHDLCGEMQGHQNIMAERSTRTWLLLQIKAFYSQGLVNTCVGHCKPDLSLTSDDASLFTPVKRFFAEISPLFTVSFVGQFHQCIISSRTVQRTRKQFCAVCPPFRTLG